MIPSDVAGQTRLLLESLSDSDVAGQTRLLLESLSDSDVSLSDSDVDSTAQEICQLVENGSETSNLVLKACLDCFTSRRSHPNTYQIEKVVSSVFKRVMKNSNLGTLLPHALKDVEVTENFVEDLTKALSFSRSEKISFALALADFDRSDSKTIGLNLLLAEIEELRTNNTGQIGSTEQVQNVLLFLQKSEELSAHLDFFIQILHRTRPRDEMYLALAPIIAAKDSSASTANEILRFCRLWPFLMNGEARDSSASIAASPDDVEAEANAYFHQYFNDHLSVDAMVEMLSRYKDSSVQREKLIFECMIGNLFEECHFFPKYPEGKLKIASILFGSVIKHELIGSLTLRMALHLVLDSLRKPADSKMFLFGTTALDQFVDRLAELHHHISDLCSTDPELATVIEQALSRISSSHLESAASVSQPGPSQSLPGNGDAPPSDAQGQVPSVCSDPFSTAKWPLAVLIAPVGRPILVIPGRVVGASISYQWWRLEQRDCALHPDTRVAILVGRGATYTPTTRDARCRLVLEPRLISTRSGVVFESDGLTHFYCSPT